MRIAVVVAAVLGLACRGGQAPALEERIAAALGPRRSLALRLPYAPLDRYRPYDVGRGASEPELLPLALAAEVAAQRPAGSLIAVQLARRDLDQAAAALVRAGIDDDLELDRAALAILQGQPARALGHLDGVLDRSPGNPVALWNRALVAESLGLPLAAAEDFAAVGERGEPGWSVEAAGRAAKLRTDAVARAERWRSIKVACDGMGTGRLPDRAMVIANPPTCRPAFYDEVRVARSREAALALAPVAEALDAAAHDAAASRLLRRIAAVEPARRQRAVDAYLRLSRTPELDVAERRRLLDELRTAEQDDLVLGAIPRSGLPGLGDEYIRRAREAGDPYFAELAEELTANALIAIGDPLGAEVVLRRAVGACYDRDVELRCSNLQLALAVLYASMYRPSDARAVAQAGIARSLRLGLYWDERLFIDHLGGAARRERAHGLMRVYLREATLRSIDECAQQRYLQELLAVASVEELRFAEARRALAAAPTCGAPPTTDRARVIAELARIDGTPDEGQALAAGLAKLRRQPSTPAGQLAYLDALEGRLRASRDPAAALPWLQRAIGAREPDRVGQPIVTDSAGLADADTAMARRDAYGSLLVLAAGAGDPAAVMALFSAATGISRRDGACAVGALIDSERVVVVACDARGACSQRFEPRGQTAPGQGAAALISPAMIRALAGCARVDVLALPPVFGQPNLLPPELAWSYRGRPARLAAAAAASPPPSPSSRPTVLTVADVTPPAELGLAPLVPRALAPIPGAAHVDLTGAEATPARVTSALGLADAIEIHAHGYVDQGVSDSSVLALSPQADRRFALGAREIAALRLPRSPLVILAACHAAYTAPYLHEGWGLPRAFLLAGARGVLASPDVISDAEAGEAFRAIEARILAGVDPAIALRDERVRRLAADPGSWIRSVLLFD